MQERSVDWGMLQKMYKNNDISAVFHYPIDEVSPNYHVKMFEVAQRLQDLVENKNRTVLVHCTSGVSRSSTVVLLH
jgi:protein-tyrosine phosphatase